MFRIVFTLRSPRLVVTLLGAAIDTIARAEFDSKTAVFDSKKEDVDRCKWKVRVNHCLPPTNGGLEPK